MVHGAKTNVNTVRQTFGERLRLRREYLDLTQEDVARQFGRGSTSISNYESGKRIPSAEEVPRLAEILSVPIGYLYGEDDEALEADFIRYFRGAPPVLQQAAVQMLKGAFAEDDAEETTHGRKAG